MIPIRDADGCQRAEDVGKDVPWVEGAVVGEQALCDFAANAKQEGADEEREVEDAPTGGVEDEVEGCREREEAQEVEGFVGLFGDEWFGGFGDVA